MCFILLWFLLSTVILLLACLRAKREKGERKRSHKPERSSLLDDTAAAASGRPFGLVFGHPFRSGRGRRRRKQEARRCGGGWRSGEKQVMLPPSSPWRCPYSLYRSKSFRKKSSERPSPKFDKNWGVLRIPWVSLVCPTSPRPWQDGRGFRGERG